MKKALLVLILIFGAVSTAFAQVPAHTAEAKPAAKIKLKDVPENHWAASAVYDLVKMGVTKGYPDGTYRGNKPITRYETAIFLSKLAKAIGGEDIKTDIKELKDQILELKKGRDAITFSGSYYGTWKIGNLLATGGAERGGASSYRLIFTASRELSEGTDIKINLDTMDYGFNDDGSSQVQSRGLLASELLDIESNLRLDLSEWMLGNPVNLKLMFGPGPKRHVSDPSGYFPSEAGVTYRRPYPGVLASTNLLGFNVRGGYYSLQGSTFETTGRINVGKITGGVSFSLSNLKVDLAGDYVSRGLFSDSERSVRAKINILAPLGDKVEAGGTVGLGRSTSSMMVAGTLSLNDLFDTGTVLLFKAAKVGSQYIDSRFAAEQFDLAGYDNFDRPLENASVNIGGVLVQTVSDRARLVGKGDLRLSSDYRYSSDKGRLTAQGGVEYNIAPNVDLDASYRVFQDKAVGDTTDMATFGLRYRF